MAGLKIMAELGGDGTGFQSMMTRAGAKVGKFKSLMAQAFTIGAIGAVTQLIRKITDYADRIDETSTRLGVATDKLQEWEYAAKQNGASAEKMLNFIEKLTLAASDPKKAGLFEKMGFNPIGMTPEEIFLNTAAFAKKTPTPELNRILSELTNEKMGGPMLNTLRSDLESLGEEARKVGAVMDQQTIQALARLNDQFSIVSQILYSNIGPALLEASKLALTAVHAVAGRVKQAKHLAGYIKPMEGLTYAMTGLAGLTAAYARLRQINAQHPEGQTAYDDEMEKLAQSIAALDRVTPFLPSPVVVPEAVALEKAGKSPQGIGLVSDALVSVGNFLGRNPALVQDIAAQQLDVSRQQLKIYQQILQKFRSRWGARRSLEVQTL